VVVALGCAWWNRQLMLITTEKVLSESRCAAATQKASAAYRKAQVERLSASMTKAGWKVVVTDSGGEYVAWPAAEKYAEALQAYKDELELAEQIERSVRRAKEIEHDERRAISD
jgi:hypothetical protein